MASSLTLPDVMCGYREMNDEIVASTWPPMMSVTIADTAL
jgi:hypothetical protein